VANRGPLDHLHIRRDQPRRSGAALISGPGRASGPQRADGGGRDEVLGAGRIVPDGVAQAPELIRYAASDADTAILGRWTVEEVRANFAVAQKFIPMTPQELVGLEARLEPMASSYDDYKRG